jgi:DNA-binding transcriptional ArsR family regulator
MSAENVDEDRRRAEVFDALSHPVRIMILKALSEESLGFADFKKKLGIESSGHLQHHISKLSGLIKTDDYGKYTLSDPGKDALHSVATVERVAGAKASENEKVHTPRGNIVLKSTVVILVVLLAFSFALAAFEYSSVLSLQSEISQRDSVIVDRDTLITQLDTALHLAESRLNLKLPNESRYLATLPDQNGEEDATKIFLSSTAAGYSYLPAYPFRTPWFNESGPFSSQRAFELTENRSVTLSFWGWMFDAGGLMAGRYEYGIGDGDPVLIIAVTVRNDYTSADLGAPIGNRTGSYISSINLAVRLYSQSSSIIQAAESENTPTNTASSRTAIGGTQFLLGTGQTKQVIFYLSPSSINIDYYEIYVSSLSAY